jgi:hypothetical protein
MLLAQELLPQLNAAGAADELARVMAVGGAGKEAAIDEDDLELKNSYSMDQYMVHATVMTDFVFDRYASENPKVGFVFVFPGLVNTNIFTSMPVYIKFALGLFKPLLNLLVFVPIEESGARNVFHLTNGLYKARDQSERSKSFVKIPEGKTIATGFNGKVGSGFYLADWNGETPAAKEFLNDYRERKVDEKIWENLQGVFKRVLSE